MKNIEALLNSAGLNKEPVFVLRAKDIHAIAALQMYIDCITVDPRVSLEFVEEIERFKKEFEEWRDSHIELCGTPD